MKSRHKKILPPMKTLSDDWEIPEDVLLAMNQMTRDTEMKADREFDALIAEKVMGWLWEVDDDGMQHLLSPHATAENFIPLPHYGTQIADAKQVLHKMIGNGYAVEITHDCVAWSVGFTHLDSGHPYYADWKDSLEVQICLAALKAVKGEGDE